MSFFQFFAPEETGYKLLDNISLFTLRPGKNRKVRVFIYGATTPDGNTEHYVWIKTANLLDRQTRTIARQQMKMSLPTFLTFMGSFSDFFDWKRMTPEIEKFFKRAQEDHRISDFPHLQTWINLIENRGEPK